MLLLIPKICGLFRITQSKYGTLRYYSDHVRVRFAPSPTGYLHLGGLRTALYNYLFAKANKGKFILRIEDTDQSRLVPGATEQLQNDLLWCGIEIHEGPDAPGNYGPYIQSQRLDLYKSHIKILLDNGAAYRCFCTDKRLNLLRRESLKLQEIPKYDNRCRHLDKEEVNKKLAEGQPFCIRFKLSENEESFNDIIYGKISYNISLNEGDPVILKSDGYPTYHFANVVDDHLMKISHVLRGIEWQISTTKHILLYRAFNWRPPEFGHLPLLLNADGTKLSKRQGDIKISYYQDNSIFPLALINFIVSAGGGFLKDADPTLTRSTILTLDELCSQFNLSNINPHSTKLNPDKLLEFNNLELKRQLQQKETEELLINKLKQLLRETYPEKYKNDKLDLRENHIKSILHWSKNRINKLSDLVSKNFEFLWVVPGMDAKSIKYFEEIKKFKEELEVENIENQDRISSFLKEFSAENKIKYSAFMKALRLVLSGLQEGPGVAEMIIILGKESTLNRLGIFINNNISKINKP